MGDLNRQDREARERMAAAERQSERQFSADPARPRRYKLYDKIAARVSVTTMNVIIGATVVLLVLAVVIGIATGNPQ
ncbi:MAG: hypothetical protein IJH86_02385 [Clostridia bacterium]|nr:hypothetical protein [Clostridia bacterium]